MCGMSADLRPPHAMNLWSPGAPVNGQPTYLATSCRASQVSDDRRDHLLVWPIYQPFSKLEPSRSFTSSSSSTDSSVRSRLAGLGSLQPKHARYALAPQMRMTLWVGATSRLIRWMFSADSTSASAGEQNFEEYSLGFGHFGYAFVEVMFAERYSRNLAFRPC